MVLKRLVAFKVFKMLNFMCQYLVLTLSNPLTLNRLSSVLAAAYISITCTRDSGRLILRATSSLMKMSG